MSPTFRPSGLPPYGPSKLHPQSSDSAAGEIFVFFVSKRLTTGVRPVLVPPVSPAAQGPARPPSPSPAPRPVPPTASFYEGASPDSRHHSPPPNPSSRSMRPIATIPFTSGLSPPDFKLNPIPRNGPPPLAPLFPSGVRAAAGLLRRRRRRTSGGGAPLSSPLEFFRCNFFVVGFGLPALCLWFCLRARPTSRIRFVSGFATSRRMHAVATPPLKSFFSPVLRRGPRGRRRRRRRRRRPCVRPRPTTEVPP